MTPTPQDINPDIPTTFPSYRPWQWQGVQDVIAGLESDAMAVFVDAPTGSGKTLLAETVRSIYDPGGSTPYICTTKTLQDQILHEFPYAMVLKGRDNYPTRFNPQLWPGESCGDCDAKTVEVDMYDLPDWLEREVEVRGSTYGLVHYRQDGTPTARPCGLCGIQPLCPYVVARDAAVEAPLCVTNMAYYLREVNGPGRLARRKLVIVDEADSFTDTILDTFTVDIPQWIMYWPGYPVPLTASRDQDIEDWIQRMLLFLSGVKNQVDTDAYKDKFGPKRQRNRLNAVNQLLTNLSIADTEDWHYEGPSQRSRKKYKYTTLRPVVVGEWVHEFVWNHSTKWLLLSASFVSVELEAKGLQLRPSLISKVKIDYSFEPKRRPVLYWPSDRPYTRAEEKAGFNAIGDMAKKIETIASWYPDERILVHTVSHKRTGEIVDIVGDSLDRPVFHFTSAGERDAAIDKYRETEGAILLGAGLERGYDFKYDECRVCIIAKTPFADLGDAIVGIRLRRGREGRAWFDLVTTRSTVQMVGRGMRAADDTLVTYLLDRSFEDYLRGNKRKFVPSEFLSAVQFGLPLKRHPIDRVSYVD